MSQECGWQQGSIGPGNDPVPWDNKPLHGPYHDRYCPVLWRNSYGVIRPYELTVSTVVIRSIPVVQYIIVFALWYLLCSRSTEPLYYNRHSIHDDVLKWKHFLCYSPLWGESSSQSPQKGQWRDFLWFLWSAPEQKFEQTNETAVIWDAIAYHDVTVNPHPPSLSQYSLHTSTLHAHQG